MALKKPALFPQLLKFLLQSVAIFLKFITGIKTGGPIFYSKTVFFLEHFWWFLFLTGSIVYILDVLDRLIYKVCPFAAGGIVVGSVYWSAVTYGAVTVMQVLGHKEGLDVMERADPLFLLIGLPTIPVMLILSKMIRWEDYILKLWRKHSPKLPFWSYFFPEIGSSMLPRVPTELMPMADPISATRVLCGALIFPTIATMCGKLMFGSLHSNLQRTMLVSCLLFNNSTTKVYKSNGQIAYENTIRRHINTIK